MGGEMDGQMDRCTNLHADLEAVSVSLIMKQPAGDLVVSLPGPWKRKSYGWGKEGRHTIAPCTLAATSLLRSVAGSDQCCPWPIPQFD